jgi:uroporphyrinogen-III synthase
LENFNAICFCSPSAVVSFFNQYQLNENIPAIAIGSTTAVKLLDYTEHVVMAESANIFAMLDISNEYLNF